MIIQELRSPEEENMNIVGKIAMAIENLNPDEASNATRDAFEAGIDVLNIIENGIGIGMTKVGEKYKNDEYHMPELLYAEEVMRICLDSINKASDASELVGVTAEAENKLLEMSRSWVGTLSSCVTRLFRYDEERKKAQE